MKAKAYRAVEIPNLALLASMFAIAAIVWPSLPNLLPVHWTGLPPAIPMRVDGYGGKVQALLLWPAIALALYVLLLLVPKISDSLPAEGTMALSLVRFLVTAFVASQYFAFLLYYKGYRVDLDAIDRDGLLVLASIASGCFIWQLIRAHL